MDSIKKDILVALEKHNGIVSVACASIGLSRSTYYLWLKDDQEFKDAVDDIQDVAIDFVESKLMEKINGVSVQSYNSKGLPVVYEQAPSDTAIIFFLKTKGKKRGYVEKTEVEHSGSIIQWHEEKTYDSDKKTD
jgi:hypothetical protein